MEKPHKNHVISRKKIRDFLEDHPGHRKSKAIFDEWFKVVERATWKTFGDVRATYGDASLVGKYVVFNVGGNKFRIIMELKYEKKLFLLRHVLTHREYDRGQWKP